MKEGGEGGEEGGEEGSHLELAQNHDTPVTDALVSVHGSESEDVGDTNDREAGDARVDVVPNASEEEGQQASEVQPIHHAIHIPTQGLLRGALRELRLELEDLLHAHVAALAHLGVLLEAHGPTADHVRVAREATIGLCEPHGFDLSRDP
jgi:hypothetical protein